MSAKSGRRPRPKRKPLLKASDSAWFPSNGKSGKDFRDSLGHSEHVAHLLPNALTEAGFWFLLQASRLTMTFHSFQWMSKFVSSSEWMVEDYSEYLKIEGSPFETDPPGGLSFYEILIFQMIWADELHLSKIVDALTAYLIDLVACAYRDNPGLVPSKARFDLDFVRKFRTINDAIRGSALAELERISRSGFSEIYTEATRVTNCVLPEKDEKDLRSLVKLRNEIVHKQGSYPEIIRSMFNKVRKPKNLIKHKPGDTAKAEIIAAKAVGLFELAAIKSGIRKAATKKQIFAGTDFLNR
jgi:hypothetical protein